MTETNTYHYGLCVLRMLMCFEVILCHFWTPNGEWVLTPFNWLKLCAVPIFMLMSFYLTAHVYVGNDDSKRQKRLWRITFPLLAWGVIYWIAFSTFSLFDSNIQVGVVDLLFQITTGHSEHFNATMWYQFDLLVITIIFICCFRHLFIYKARLILYLLLSISLALQYSGINYFLFENLRFELKYPLGRIAETLPYAIIGFELAYNHWLDNKKTKSYAIVPIALLIFIFLQFRPILRLSLSFNYGGISLFISSLCAFLLFYFAPMKNMPVVIQKTILFASRYTLGIYCVHRLIAYILKQLSWRLNISINSFLFCILLYSCCFMGCHFVSKVPSKIVKQIIN